MNSFFARLVLAGFVVVGPSAHAFLAFCGLNHFEGYVPNKSLNRFVYSSVELDCVLGRNVGESSHDGAITLKTYGPNLQGQLLEGLVIFCPFVGLGRVNRVIEQNGKWSAVGLGAGANFMFGGRVGVGINHRGAMCALSGLSLMSLGASGGVIEIEITRPFYNLNEM